MQLSADIIYEISISMKTIQLSISETLNIDSKQNDESKIQNKIQHNNCGFGLCPKKYKYLANPQLLEEIFTNPNPQISETTKSTKNKGWMDVIACESCGQQGLLRLDNPLCVSCRRIY